MYSTHSTLSHGEHGMSLVLYLVGYAFVIGGIVWALLLAGVKPAHIAIAVLILVGIAIITGVKHTRPKD